MPADAKADTATGTTASGAKPVAAWGVELGPRVMALGAVLVGAKAAVWALRVHDGAAPPWSPWLPVALIHEDARLLAAFTVLGAALAAGAAWAHGRPRTRVLGVGLAAAGAALYLALVIWTAGNVPVVRALSSPLTSAMLHATGTAISDSVGTYVTVLNVGIPLALVAVGVALPGVLRRASVRERRIVAAAITVAVAVAVLMTVVVGLGPFAVRRADVSGWHANAALTLIQTSLAPKSARRGQPLPSLDSSACRPEAPPLSAAAGDKDTAAALRALPVTAAGRNIVWIVLESTGARALGAYGAGTSAGTTLTPHLDALAGEAFVFENAYTGYPESIKGLYATLCARLPPAGVEAAQLGAEHAPCPTASAALAAAGWSTGLFHSGWFAYLGMRGVVTGRGFGTLVDAQGMDSPLRTSFGVDDRATATRLLTWVDGLPSGRRFFAAFMPIAGHHPYHAPSRALRPVPERDDHDAYLNELHIADDAVGLLRDGLRARGLDQRTAYIVVGDHGEAFREHPGNIAHALFVYEENVRVPFFIAAPGALAHPERVPALASLIDLSPTTLALAGLPIPPGLQGQSLLTGAPRVARFFTDQGVPRWGLRDGRWKLIQDGDSGRARLFDLDVDPGETRDLAADHPALVRRYLTCLGG